MGGAGGAENDDARGSVRGESSGRAYQNAEVVHLASDDEEPAETWMQYAVHRYRLIGSARHPTEPVTTATVISVVIGEFGNNIAYNILTIVSVIILLKFN